MQLYFTASTWINQSHDKCVKWIWLICDYCSPPLLWWFWETRCYTYTESKLKICCAVLEVRNVGTLVIMTNPSQVSHQEACLWFPNGINDCKEREKIRIYLYFLYLMYFIKENKCRTFAPMINTNGKCNLNPNRENKKDLQSDLGYPATSGPAHIRISDLAGYERYAWTQQVQ